MAKTEEEYGKLFHLDKLTSSVFGPDNAPKDWADGSFLLPHETMRREMDKMNLSADKLVSRIKDKSYQPWQGLYFCDWYVEVFEPFVHMHHDAEEEIYFPWLAAKVEIPAKKYGKSHEELVSALQDIGSLCQKVVNKKGEYCDSEIKEIKRKINQFVPDMNAHLKEEEDEIPPLARLHFTEQQEKDEVVAKIIAKAPLSDLRGVFPSVLLGMEEWATQELIDDVLKTMPGPLVYMMNNYFIPDYKTVVAPKRDAPFLDEKPPLTKLPCCGISFCFSCIC